MIARTTRLARACSERIVQRPEGAAHMCSAAGRRDRPGGPHPGAQWLFFAFRARTIHAPCSHQRNLSVSRSRSSIDRHVGDRRVARRAVHSARRGPGARGACHGACAAARRIFRSRRFHLGIGANTDIITNKASHLKGDGDHRSCIRVHAHGSWLMLMRRSSSCVQRIANWCGAAGVSNRRRAGAAQRIACTCTTRGELSPPSCRPLACSAARGASPARGWRAS